MEELAALACRDHTGFAESGRGSVLSPLLTRLIPAASRRTSLTIGPSQN